MFPYFGPRLSARAGTGNLSASLVRIAAAVDVPRAARGYNAADERHALAHARARALRRRARHRRRAAGLGAPSTSCCSGSCSPASRCSIDHHAEVALTGLAAIVAYELAVTRLRHGAGPRRASRCTSAHEWVTLANLLGLLLGFALLAQHFEDSHLTVALARRCCPAVGAARSCCSRWCSCCRRSSTTSRRR